MGLSIWTQLITQNLDSKEIRLPFASCLLPCDENVINSVRLFILLQSSRF
jgi:hypothetical protein